MVPEVCENRLATRIELSAEPAGIGVGFERMRRSRCRSFAGWPAIVGVEALLVAGCGERSPPTRTACEASRAPASDRPQDRNPAEAKRLQGTLDRVRREQKIPGAAAAVVIGGCLWVGASGFADVRTREPVRIDVPDEPAPDEPRLRAEQLLGDTGPILSVPLMFSRSMISLTARAAAMLTAWPELWPSPCPGASSWTSGDR